MACLFALKQNLVLAWFGAYLAMLHGYSKGGDVSVSDTRRILRYTILVDFLLRKCVSAYPIRIVSDTRTRTRVT
jgi:hypothetical protein